MKKIKFIHCSDIHIGADPFGIEERFEDMGNAFKQVVENAIVEQVDFVLIPGDFFHKKQLNAKILDQAISLLEPLKQNNIPVYVTEGNHDMSNYTNTYSWLEFLSSKGYIHLLIPQVGQDKNMELLAWDEQNRKGSFIEIEECCIVGLGYPGSTAKEMIEILAEQYEKILDDKKLIITMLHTGIDKFITDGMGGLREEEIQKIVEYSDYIALGHIHKRYISAEKKYYNPGSLENIHFNQIVKESSEENPFDKGFFYVEIDSNTKKLEVEFKKVKIRNSFNITIDVSDLNEIEEIYDYVVNYIKEQILKLDEKIMLHLKLKGTLKSGGTLVDIQRLKKCIKEKIPVLYIEVLSFVSAKKEINDFIDLTKTREEIDEIVISDLIKQEGFEENQGKDILEIVLKLKEYAKEEEITIDKLEGQEIENLLLKLIENS